MLACAQKGAFPPHSGISFRHILCWNLSLVIIRSYRILCHLAICYVHSTYFFIFVVYVGKHQW